VCAACEGAGFALDEEAYVFLVDALARPLAEAPSASERALRQAERAIGETVEHHGHVRWRPAAAA
jgi:DNA repair protein RecO (recombination protein O)